MSASKFLYPYTVRRSARARHVRLVVSAGGLEVAVPQKFCVSRGLSAILEEKKEWITKALAKVAKRAQQREETVGLPDTVELRVVDETWRVVFAPLTRARLVAEGGVLTLTLEFSESEALAALRMWTRQKGREILPPLLDEAARFYGFSYAGVTVKEQKSLWGSCSARGNVNLNGRLLFLPRRLVRHVLLHELCHLKEMNHSAGFHGLLSRLDPNAAANARDLKEAWRFVPGWVLRE